MTDSCTINRLRYRKAPCEECPFRRDTPPGKFPAERYESLRETAGSPGREAPLDAPIFACHMTHEGRDQACAGWLAVVGVDHLGMRVAVAMDRLPGETLNPGEGWPELFDSYDEMAETQGGETT